VQPRGSEGLLTLVVEKVLYGDWMGERLGKVGMAVVVKCIKNDREDVRRVLRGARGVKLVTSCVAACVGGVVGGENDGNSGDWEWYVSGANQRMAMTVIADMGRGEVVDGNEFMGGIEGALGRFGEEVVRFVQGGIARSSIKFWFVVSKVCRGEDTLENARARLN